MAEQYYIYRNSHRRRGRVHLASRSHCDHGRRTQATDSGKNGEWHGPFDRNAAFEFIEQAADIDIQPCMICKP